VIADSPPLSQAAELAGRDPEARDHLTPQELHIAELAAEGLTNDLH
jgi:DNA-binding NarL/FixJ family response regulator